ncbi:hypothetical protein [Paenibacillus illinoisensis]|uniref:hypothetical protein n=1 Tax=Paenibacillus illinoisensis TaxID=59845 RepID=UPI00301C5920
MKRNILFMPFISFIVLLFGCSSSSGSFASDKMIKIKNEVYITSNETVTEDELVEQIGEIEVSSTNERDLNEANTVSSNTYKVGTRLFKMNNKDTKDMIAVEDSTSLYFIAYNNKYTAK